MLEESHSAVTSTLVQGGGHAGKTNKPNRPNIDPS